MVPAFGVAMGTRVEPLAQVLATQPALLYNTSCYYSCCCVYTSETLDTV